MDFILNEAEVKCKEDYKLVFSGDKYKTEDASTVEEEDSMFIDNSLDEEEDRSFYRDLDNRENYLRFPNQTRNPIEVVNEPEEEYYEEDNMPEIFDPENREEVSFDLFANDKDKASKFKSTLVCFPDIVNHFFYAVIYGLMSNKLNGRNFELENADESLGNDFFIKLKEIEVSAMLDHSIFGFFYRCCQINEVLSEHNYFLRFYKRRNKFRYKSRQKVKTKNKMRKELSACVVQKFNGYEMLRNHLNNGETKDFIPIDIVYEPNLDTKKTILCYFAPFVHLGFHTTVERLKDGKTVLNHTGARQCHYCNNYFVKSPEKMKKHLFFCSGKAGFTFSFNNGKTIDYQDQYKNLGDVPFGIYYDFETTAGSIVFFDAKIFVVSYCMAVAFHPDLDLPRICIFRSYDQTHEQLTSLSLFEALEYNFFADKEHYNRSTLKQLDSAFSVQNREKNTALAEMFSIELKFTVDCLKFWFQKNRKVIELSVEEKAYYKQKNP